MPQDNDASGFDPTEPLRAFFDMQGETMREMFAQTMTGASAGAMPDLTAGKGAMDGLLSALPSAVNPADMAEWTKASTELQQMWLEFVGHQAKKAEQS